MSDRDQALASFKKELEDNISKIAIVLPKLQKEVAKSYHYFNEQHSFEWLEKVKQVTQYHQLFVNEIKTYVGTTSSTKVGSAIAELFESMQHMIGILLTNSLNLYKKHSENLKYRGDSPPATKKGASGNNTSQATANNQTQYSLNNQSHSYQKPLTAPSSDMQQFGTSTSQVPARRDQKKGYMPKKSVFDEDAGNDEEAFIQQYANRNADGSYELHAGKVFERQTELLGKITDEYAESIKQIDQFLEARLPKRRMKTSNVLTDMQEISYKMSSIKAENLGIDTKALQLATQLAKDERAQEFLEEVAEDQEHLIIKVMAVQKVVHRSRMRHVGTDPDNNIFNLQEKLKLIYDAEQIIENLRGDLDNKKRDIFDLRAKLRDVEENLTNFRRRVDRAEKDANAFKDETTKMKMEYVETQQKINKKKKKIAKLKEQLEETASLQKRYDALLKEKDALQSNRDKLQNELMSLSVGNKDLQERLRGYSNSFAQEKQKGEVLKDGIITERRRSFRLQKELDQTANTAEALAKRLDAGSKSTERQKDDHHSKRTSIYAPHTSQNTQSSFVEGDSTISKKKGGSDVLPISLRRQSSTHRTASLNSADVSEIGKEDADNISVEMLSNRYPRETESGGGSLTKLETRANNNKENNDIDGSNVKSSSTQAAQAGSKRASIRASNPHSLRSASNPRGSAAASTNSITDETSSVQENDNHSQVAGAVVNLLDQTEEIEKKQRPKGKIFKGGYNQTRRASMMASSKPLLGAREGLIGTSTFGGKNVNFGRTMSKLTDSVMEDPQGVILEQANEADFEMSQEMEKKARTRTSIKMIPTDESKKADPEGIHILEKFFDQQDLSPVKRQSILEFINLVTKSTDDSPNRFESIAQTFLMQKTLESTPGFDQEIRGFGMAVRKNSIRATSMKSLSKLNNLVQEHTASQQNMKTEPWVEQLPQDMHSKKLMPIAPQNEFIIKTSRQEYREESPPKTERSHQILTKINENLQQLSETKTDRPMTVSRYGSTERSRPITSEFTRIRFNGMQSREGSRSKTNASSGMRKTGMANPNPGPSGWSILEALQGQQNPNNFDALNEEEDAERIHDGVNQFGNLQIDLNVISKTQEKPNEETLVKLYEHINADPSLKRQIHSIIRETIKVSKIENEKENVLETFQTFKKYYENLMTGHSKCGNDCIHLRRFYSKLKFNPTAPSNRQPMAIPVSVIKQPVFNGQKL